MMRGNNFANGASVSGGQSTCNGPYSGPESQGWDIRPLATIWDGTEGRPPR